MLKYRLDYQPFVGCEYTQHAYSIQFSDDGYDWFDLGEDFNLTVASIIIGALVGQNYTHFEDLRPRWTDNKDML